jgi:hypothetical protein
MLAYNSKDLAPNCYAFTLLQLLPAQILGTSLLLAVAICWDVAQSNLYELCAATSELCDAPVPVVCLSCLRAEKGSLCCLNE